MIRQVPTGLEASFATALSTATPLTIPEKLQLKTELISDPTSRGYAGKSEEAKLQLLSSAYTTTNTQTQARVSREEVPQGELIVLVSLVQGRKVGALLAGATLPDALNYLIDTVLPSVALQVSNRTDNQEALAMLNALVTAGLLSATEKNDLLTEPDTSFHEDVQHESRLKQIFGAAVLPDLAELREALA